MERTKESDPPAKSAFPLPLLGALLNKVGEQLGPDVSRHPPRVQQLLRTPRSPRAHAGTVRFRPHPSTSTSISGVTSAVRSRKRLGRVVGGSSVRETAARVDGVVGRRIARGAQLGDDHPFVVGLCAACSLEVHREETPEQPWFGHYPLAQLSAVSQGCVRILVRVRNSGLTASKGVVRILG